MGTSLEDKDILIVGGSSGIGLAVAKQVYEFDVYLNPKKQKPGQAPDRYYQKSIVVLKLI